jgi:uncharacterized protein (TIGR03437 family)
MYRCLSLLAVCAALTAAADVRRGEYRGRPVTFENVDGLAIYQGDIVLGTTAEVERAPDPAKSRESSTVSSSLYLWPGARIPYTIDSTLSSALQQRILSAIDHWNTRTPVSLIPRTPADFSYVRFTTSTNTVACSSSVGMAGGQQLVRLPDACGLGPIIHEIGHAVGLWHEQERADRNRFITVLYENIDKAYIFNYDQAGLAGADLGPYDFNSIMHYGAYSFSRDGIAPAIETVPAGIPIGQRAGLSSGDLEAVQRLYGAPPVATTISTTPSGLKIFVDGALVDDLTSFTWAPGSKHELRAPFQGDNNTRYYFASWSDGGTEKHTITASAGATLFIANFVRQRKIGVAVTPGDGGTVRLLPAPEDGFYNERSNIQLLAIPAAGYRFADWNLSTAPAENPRFLTVNGPGTLVAAFTRGNLTTITSDPPGRPVIVDDIIYATPVSFSWVSGTRHSLDVDTTQPDFVHYTFNGWTDGAPQRRTIVATGEAQTFTAAFTTQYSLTLNYSPRNGSIAVNPASPDGFYDAGSTIQLRAEPSSGLVFAGWGGDLGGADNPATVVMNDQKLVTAIFGTGVPVIAAASAASGLAGGVAAGEIVVIYGTNLGPPSLTPALAAGGKLTTSLAGTQVFFDGVAAPLIYTSATQVSAVAPYAIARKSSTSLRVSFSGQSTPAVSLMVAASRPALFTTDQTGRNNAAALNENGTVNSAANPARRGKILVLFATGEGETVPAGVDGQLADSIYPRPVLPVSVRIGGQPAAVHYAGAAPGFVAGAMQINVQVPDNIRSGPAVPIRLVIGDTESRSGVTVAVE